VLIPFFLEHLSRMTLEINTTTIFSQIAASLPQFLLVLEQHQAAQNSTQVHSGLQY